MSVLFNEKYNANGQQKEYRRLQVQPPRRIGEKDKRNSDENLLVFGYACQIFQDEEKAEFFANEKHLIPLMGDESLMIDRYDGRLLLDDLSQFAPKDPFNYQAAVSSDELELEKLCDKERYLALDENLTDIEYEEEEEMKRFKAAIASDSAYGAVGFSYEQPYPQYNYETTQEKVTSIPHYYPYVNQQTVELVPETTEDTSSFQKEEEEEVEVFVPPEELGVPEGMEVPDTRKLHAIIERTAFFIKDHGAQMEIVVKAKQSGNQQFDFLHFDHALNPYYKLTLQAIRDGTYEVMSSKPPSPPTPPPEEETDDSDDEGMELHPLLTASLRTPIVSTKAKSLPASRSEQPLPPGWTAVTTETNSRDSSFSGMSQDTSFSGTNTMNMAMTLAPHHLQMSLLPPPPPPGENAPQTNEFDHQHQFDPSSYPFHFPLGTYPDNRHCPGDPDMSSYSSHAGPPIIPPPPDLKPICDKLAQYVARNGQQFEDNIKAKGDPRFDFLNETSDHYTYYHMKREEFKQNPSKSSTSQKGTNKARQLVPYIKPVSFQIKAKDTGKKVIEYRSSILYKTAKADESDEEGEGSKENGDQNKDASQNGNEASAVAGPKTEEDVIAEERATKLKEEKEKEVQRLEEDAKSTTSTLRRQVQLERRRRAQLFINMLKKTKPSSEATTLNQSSSDSKNIFEPPAPS